MLAIVSAAFPQDNLDALPYHNDNQKEALFGNTARAMVDAPMKVKIRHISNCMKADPDYGKGVAKALKTPLSKIPK